MDVLTRADFSRGWVPSADAVHAPPNGLLRADNLVLDERGVVGLRRGSAKINGAAFANLDIHSLYTVTLSGTRYRMAGADNKVYANGTALAPVMGGSGDTAFGSHLGHILFARSTSKHKYDGSTVRTWGLAAPNAAPTVASIAADGKTFASFDSAEAPAFVINEDDGTGAAFAAGYEGTANGALVVNPSTATGRARVTKTFAADQDFTVYDAAQTGRDDDVIGFYVYITEPQYVESITLQIDFNTTALFQNDQFYYIWWFNQRDEQGNVITPAPSVGWNFLQVKRSAMNRYEGATAGRGWNTVRAVRLDVRQTAGGAAAQVRFDRLRISGGSSSPMTGQYEWLIVAVTNFGSYHAKSGPSAVSAKVDLTAQGATLTVAAGVISALDANVNELWVFRRGGNIDDWYRTKVHTGGPWGGAQTINDTLSDADALIANVKLEAYNTTPPDNIIAIVGPHYDRTFALTSTFLYPSQPRNPDSFDSRHPVLVGDASETALWVVKVREELFVGTTKDIYRFEGDWTLLPDGDTLNVTKRPLAVAQPPISSAIAQDGDTVLYLAADGWRVLGGPQPVTNGDVDLLYRGYTRHGVSPVNLTGGRFKAALANGWFTAITPEGASTTSSTVLHRYVSSMQRWYRHTYGRNWRCVYREPDGTLIASDNAGFVWTLDTGTQDDGSDIAVVLWTPIEANGQPNQRKDGWELRVRANTGGATATVALHLDGAGSSSTLLAVAASDLTPVAGSLSAVAAFRQSQLRVTGSFSTFLWYDYTLTYRGRPPVLVFAEPKPEVRGTRRKRFAGLTVVLDTLGAAAAVTPVLDDTDLGAQSVTTSDAVSTALTFQSVVGRDLWAKISKATGFEFYGIEPNVLAELPPPIQGRIPDSNGGTPQPKVVTGVRIRACTLGVARTFTPIVDGTSLTTFSATTHADEPDEIVHSFSAPRTATDIAFSVDGNIELYEWAPIIDSVLPLGRTLWDSGPIELGSRVVWVPRLELKAKLTADLTITPYVDDVVQDAVTVAAAGAQPITTYTVALPRPIRGRQVRFRLSSTAAFYLWWLEPLYRVTGKDSDLQRKRVTL
ncbi:MAG TPA: hypothetical protein VEA16_00710 [Vicinamibacterales bacterium]|nr:hypothetical protein [Vicinamibacterales bacterium]